MSAVNKAKFTGKVAFVTGGGDGIGRAVAVAKGGASVVVAGGTEAKLKEKVQLIEDAGGKGLAVTLRRATGAKEFQ